MTDRKLAQAFVVQLKELIRSGGFRDPANFEALMAEQVTFFTPRFWKPMTNRQWVSGILSTIPQAIDGFEYLNVWIDQNQVLMEFHGTVDGKGLNGLDIFTLDDTGKFTELKVLIRPLNALSALGEKEDVMIKEHFGIASLAEFSAKAGTPTA